jgi:hypothetical protein
MARYKTPEEIEAAKKLQAERYPDITPSDVDPTQANRDALKRLIQKSPIVQSASDNPETFDMSPEIKRYGYNLFGMDQIAPSDVEIPFPVGQEPVEEISPQDLEPQESPEQEAAPARQPAALQEAALEPKQMPSENLMAAQAEPLPAPEQQAQPDIDAMIKQKQEEEDRAALWKQSAKLRDAAMGAGSGTILKTDTSLYEDLEKRAQRPMQNLLLKQELGDKKAKNDPNSDISKLLRKSLSDLGMNMQGLEGIPYSQLEKLYPSLTQALYTKIAADARKEEAEARRYDKQADRERRADVKEKENYFKVQSGIDRQVQQLRTSKAYIGYQQANQAKQLLNEAINSKDPVVKVQNAAAFMNYAKTAQGDDSVVRSEDMKVLAGQLGFNSPSELLSKLSSRAKGTPFTPAELNMMTKVIGTIQSTKRKQLQSQLNPIISRAESNAYPISESLDPDFIREIQEEPTVQETYSPKQEAGIKAYMSAKGLSREEAIQKLKAAKRL